MRRVGLDLALKGEHVAAVAEDHRLVGKPFRVQMTQEGFEELVRRASAGQNAKPLEFVLEPTGNVWVPVAALLHAQGHQVVMVRPQKSADLRKFYRRHTKTDGIDACSLARVPAVDSEGTHPWCPVEPDILHLRRVLKQRHRFVDQARAHKLRLHSLLQLTNPHLMKALGDDKFTATGRYLMGRMVNPLKVVAQGRRRFEDRLRRAAGGRLNAESAEKIWKAYTSTAGLYRSMDHQGRLPFRYEDLQEEARCELTGLEFAEKQVKELDKKIKRLYEAVDRTRMLEQLPGLGELHAPTVEAFAAPIGRFGNVGAFAAYCGIVPRRHDTGGRSDKPQRMTKAGPALLKRALRMAGDTARHWDPEFAAAYARYHRKGWHHEKILGVLAHMMARRVYALLKKREQSTSAAPSYQSRTPDGEVLDKTTAANWVKTHYPSKAERKRRQQTESIATGAPGAARTISGPPPSSDATRRAGNSDTPVADRVRSTAPRAVQPDDEVPPWGPCPNGYRRCISECCWDRASLWFAAAMPQGSKPVDNPVDNL